MKIRASSHLDHGLTAAHLAWIADVYGGRDAFFIVSVVLPDHLPSLPCDLHGPVCGDPVVDEADVVYAVRGDRAWTSRLVRRAPRPSRTITIIGGPVEDEPCALLTAFGGPLAPQETGDPRCRDVDEALRFWREHALSMG